jgi:hypothetical protein
MAISCSQEMMTARVVGIRYDSDRKNATNTGQKMTFFAYNFLFSVDSIQQVYIFGSGRRRAISC